ncbi:MAG: hypothetical protein DMF00_13115 [Verrucomicrobia bacterium]|nr:MAG: hypothetical protein DMF00_13115 [Verrucomicrobiota bacterium]
MYFLPWLLLFPFARFSKFHDQSQRRFAHALTWGIALPFLGVNLVPGAVARYSMPAIVPACWLLALTFVGNALQWPGKLTTNDRNWTRVVAIFVSLGIVIGAIGYPFTAIILKNRQQIKKAAAEINAVVSPNEMLYAVDPDYQPVFFYINAPLNYVSDIKKLPADTHYFLVRTGNEAEATNAPNWSPMRAHPVARVRDYSKRELILFKVAP